MYCSVSDSSRPIDRAGEGGKVFPSPQRCVWGPCHHPKKLKGSKVFQMASFWCQICIKSIFSLGFAPDPAGGAMMLPHQWELITLPLTQSDGEGTPLSSFLTLNAYGWGWVRPCKNGFPGRAVALGKPAQQQLVLNYHQSLILITPRNMLTWVQRPNANIAVERSTENQLKITFSLTADHLGTVTSYQLLNYMQ